MIDSLEKTALSINADISPFFWRRSVEKEKKNDVYTGRLIDIYKWKDKRMDRPKAV